MIADPGFDGQFWLAHWANDYAAQVVTLPSEADHPWFSALRQVVETAFANLCDSFGLKYPGAHTTWGLITGLPPSWRPTQSVSISTVCWDAQISPLLP